MNGDTRFISATPVLASLDIVRSVEFFVTKLGFTKQYAAQSEYGIVTYGSIQIHFWNCKDPLIAQATSCRVQVQGIESVYAQCQSHGIVHPNAALAVKPWGNKEFSVLDPDGNLVTFYESASR